jgi:hypothetical protein
MFNIFDVLDDRKNSIIFWCVLIIIATFMLFGINSDYNNNIAPKEFNYISHEVVIHLDKADNVKGALRKGWIQNNNNFPVQVCLGRYYSSRGSELKIIAAFLLIPNEKRNLNNIGFFESVLIYDIKGNALNIKS